MKRNILYAVIAMVMTASVSCGGKKDVSSSDIHMLPVAIQTGTISYYTEPAAEIPLVPYMKQKISGTDYSLCVLNTEVIDFKTASVQKLIDTATGEFYGDKVQDFSNSDFHFHGFRLSDTMFVELTKNGEPVSTFNEKDLNSYEFKALYTSAELLGDKGNYLTFGARTFIGLTKDEVEMTLGKGYTSGFDENTFYYPDAAGCTLALTYKMGKPADTSTETDAEKTPDETNEELILSELFFFME